MGAEKVREMMLNEPLREGASMTASIEAKEASMQADQYRV
jgi:hypothetical protein